jgi:2-polyprenyl-3-methyl-5-hydroxy-6-metoxy-1,4-benzoquinol methylase
MNAPTPRTSDRRDPPYLMGRTDVETQRLARQAELYEPLTRRLLVEAGVKQGARVLEVGSGAGHMAALLAELVGPTGSVLGVEANPMVLETARAYVARCGLQNVTFVEGDVRNVALDERFDGVIGRFVLHWVADAVDVLRACAAHVKPGGVVVFQEHDMLDTPQYRAFPSAAASPFAELLQVTVEQQGIDVSTSYRMYAAFLDAGLASPRMLYEAPIGGGRGWLGYAVMDGHAQRFGPLMLQAGLATSAQLDLETFLSRLEDELVEARGVLRCLPTVGIWARAP